MRTNSGMNRHLRLTGALLTAALLAGCAAGAPPYQARTPGSLSYGYADAKIDASHYSVLYTDNNAQRAQDNLKVHAAEVAKAAGYSYFSFDTKGVAAQRMTEAQFDLNQISDANRRASDRGAGALNGYMDQNTPSTQQVFYTAAGRISLLAPQQAQGNPNAIAVAAVLAGAGSTER